MTIHPEDIEFRDTKLKNYKLYTDYDNIQTGMHFRTTQNRYQESGRKCGYVVVQKVDAEGIVLVNRYSPINEHEFPDWVLKLDCPYRKIRIYKKNN
jgi:hypothetical protein